MNAHRSGERGLSLTEAIIAFTLLALLTALVVRSITDLSVTQSYTRGQAALALVTDRVARMVEQDALTSAYTFDRDQDGLAFLDTLQLSAPLPPRLAGSRLPSATNRGWFDRDGDNDETGNVLLLARGAGTSLVPIQPPAPPPPPPPPLPILGGLLGGSTRTVTPPPPAPPPRLHRVDLLRFLVYYVSQDASGRLDLNAWVGPRMAKLGDIEALTDESERAQCCAKLHEAGVQHAFRVGETRARGLFTIRANGALQLLPPSARLEPDVAESRPRMLANLHVQLARNGALAQPVVPRFATPAGAFPGGFEVKVDGGATGRMMLLRLVLVQTKRDGRLNWGESQRLVNTAQK